MNNIYKVCLDNRNMEIKAKTRNFFINSSSYPEGHKGKSQIKAIFKEGIFQPLRKIKNINEGQIIEINIETSEKENISEISMQGGSFDFLENEEDIYSEKDLI